MLPFFTFRCWPLIQLSSICIGTPISTRSHLLRILTLLSTIDNFLVQFRFASDSIRVTSFVCFKTIRYHYYESTSGHMVSASIICPNFTCYLPIFFYRPTPTVIIGISDLSFWETMHAVTPCSFEYIQIDRILIPFIGISWFHPGCNGISSWNHVIGCHCHVTT